MRTLACPATGEFGIFCFPTLASTAASYWIGPSTKISGRWDFTICVASRTLSTSSPLPEVPEEYDKRATLGSIPKAFAESADVIAISASCSAVGLGTIAQSP